MTSKIKLLKFLLLVFTLISCKNNDQSKQNDHVAGPVENIINTISDPKEDLVGDYAYEQGGKSVIKITKKGGNFYASTLDQGNWTTPVPLVEATEANYNNVFGDNWKDYVKAGLINPRGFGIFKVEKGYKRKNNSTFKTGYCFVLGIAGGDAYKL